jgi:hypothetical protein
VAPAVARKWGRWLVWGLALALTLRIAGAFLNWVSLIDHVRVLRGAARFDISVTVSLWTAFAVGIVGGVGGAAMIGLFGTFVGVLQGLTGPDIERRTIPNQGIRQSVRNIGVFFLIGAVAVGVPFGLLNLASAWIYTGVFPDVDDLVRSVGNGAFIMGLLGGFVPGAVCLQHFTLRFVLWCQGAIPWRYVRFLDHATERMLLQRIGGRYRFIHVLLRDHLASKA